ncbi:KAP family P-loop NTPase fold protein [Catenovulum adriaticum]|uniref:KAP family NTPase n=1 Tax=Catenovulum adriaticum TaxID=2984846 RepID=A0ABY7AJJ0_9ALTE|nr:P-loop NTPase fold protein [Catenovulum sp. TS8]WAJ69755.1 KAP family NTPase [Catenovulum sp. TS8]
MGNNKSKYASWLSEYTFENCKLNRGEYGKFLADYITGEHDGFVLNLNGAWGTGKTEFLRRLYTELVNRKHPTIYIDAWESDFSQVPLTVVASELLTQVKSFLEVSGGDLDMLKHYLGKAIKAAVVGGAGYITKELMDDAGTGREVAKILFESEPEGFLNQVKSGHEEQVTAIIEIRKSLSRLAKSLSEGSHDNCIPVMVLVDELDRCRPSYAIEMLEVIKHFFTTPNFVFVVATDTKQLQTSIRAVYGNDFDSATYLKRFFNRTAELSEPDILNYLNTKHIEIDLSNTAVKLYPGLNYHFKKEDLVKFLTWCFEAYGLSVRDTDQIIAKLNACLRYIYKPSKDKNSLVNAFALVLAIIEHDLAIPQFYSRTNDKAETYSTELTNIYEQSMKLKNPIVENRYENVHLFKIIQFIHEVSVYHTRDLRNELDDICEELGYCRFKVESNPATVLTEIQRSVQKIFDGVNNQPNNYKIWLWDDYRKLVLLAGHID